jgi:hypothetical protein
MNEQQTQLIPDDPVDDRELAHHAESPEITRHFLKSDKIHRSEN